MGRFEAITESGSEETESVSNELSDKIKTLETDLANLKAYLIKELNQMAYGLGLIGTSLNVRLGPVNSFSLTLSRNGVSVHSGARGGSLEDMISHYPDLPLFLIEAFPVIKQKFQKEFDKDCDRIHQLANELI